MQFLKKLARVLVYIALALMAIYLIFYLLAWGDYEVANTVEQDPSIPHLTISDVTFHSESFGNPENPVVIVLHGGPGNDYKYLLALKSLANEYYVVFYDQRGTGLSPRVPGEQLTLENMVEDLHNIVLHFGKGNPVNIIGHSWGGMLASAYIGKYPNTVNKLILAEPGPLTPTIAKVYEAELKLTINWELIVHLGKAYFKSLHVEEIDDQARNDFFFQYFTSTKEVEHHPMAPYFCNNDITNADFDYWRFSATSSYEIMMKGMQGDKSSMNLADGGKAFTNKILFLAGDCNQLIGPDFQEQQRLLFANTEMVIINNAGHFMFSEEPDACDAAVRNFMQE